MKLIGLIANALTMLATSRNTYLQSVNSFKSKLGTIRRLLGM